jgi:predicted O-methyltransferase YrrM
LEEESLNRYLTRLNGGEASGLQALAEEARAEGIPIMQPEALAVLLLCIRMKRPNTILEIGTAIGYSAIQMVLASGRGARVVTVERDPILVGRARDNVARFNLQDAVEVIEGDALEAVEAVRVHGPYDFIVIDAGKGHYKEYFTTYAAGLVRGGVVFCDNVLFRRHVLNPEAAPKRIRRLAAKMDAFNRWLARQSGFDTMFLSVGDGVSISIRK